jgi:lipopolysaccharide biosynthesis glycosyltransferase
MKPIPIFVGYDPREAVAYHTCSNSIIRHASQPVAIIPLALNLFKDYTETHTDGSNQFIYSRFLVPHLMGFSGHAIFIDGDMIVRGDIAELWNLRELNVDVQVVKHDYKTKMTEKYLGAKNEDYPRKNWSSVMIFNCQNFPTKKLTPEYIQKSTGAHLHRFEWTTDDRVGELPPEWNWLPDEYGANPGAKLLHYTLGTPCFHEFATTPQGDEWHKEHMLADYCLQRTDI